MPAKPAPTPPPALLAPAEEALLDAVVLSRPRGWWARFRNGIAEATRVVLPEEFQRCAEAIRKDLDGQAIHPELAAEKAVRLMEAHTGKESHCAVAKCDKTETAVMVIYMGNPKAGYFFSRSLALKDPKGARRG
jgi:hypothetical protein